VAKSLNLRIVGMDVVEASIKPFTWKKRIEAGMGLIITDAAGRLAEASPVGVTGHLQGAWTQTRGVDFEGTQITGYVDPRPGAAHAEYVLHGTGPHVSNPWRYIVPWVEKKLGLAGAPARRVAFFIGRKRVQQGSKANDFTVEVAEEAEPIYTNMLERALIVDA
jgi:hypothetical protein